MLEITLWAYEGEPLVEVAKVQVPSLPYGDHMVTGPDIVKYNGWYFYHIDETDTYLRGVFYEVPS